MNNEAPQLPVRYALQLVACSLQLLLYFFEVKVIPRTRLRPRLGLFGVGRPGGLLFLLFVHALIHGLKAFTHLATGPVNGDHQPENELKNEPGQEGQ